MAALRTYTNESVPVAVARGLKRRGVDAWSALDVDVNVQRENVLDL